jgi:hypothetical protein
MDEPTQQQLATAKTVRALAGNIIALCEGWPSEEIASALAMALGFVLATQVEEPHDVLAQTFDELTSLIDEWGESESGYTPGAV